MLTITDPKEMARVMIRATLLSIPLCLLGAAVLYYGVCAVLYYDTPDHPSCFGVGDIVRTKIGGHVGQIVDIKVRSCFSKQQFGWVYYYIYRVRIGLNTAEFRACELEPIKSG